MSCQGQPLPYMFVSKEFDNAVIGNFLKKKYPALCELIGKPESAYFYYSLEDFTALITQSLALPGAFGMRTYFASYCLTGNEAVDTIVGQDYNDRMTLIFAPTGDPASNTPDLGHYYIISPMGGVIEITEPVASLLFENYKQNKRPLLEAIIKNAGKPATFKETVSSWLPLAWLSGPRSLISEAQCQEATGIMAFLGTYDKDYVLAGANVGWQLTFIFELTKTISFNSSSYQYVFDIEDTAGFNERSLLTESTLATAGFNTISPCPPATNCGGLCHDC
jgi:hypothetical protein